MIIYRIALVLGALAVAAPVRAQMDVYRGVELWGGYAGWSGKDAAGLKPGIQGGLAYFGEASERLGFGLEAMFGSVGRDVGDNATELGLNVVMRQAFGDRASAHVFGQARAGWHRLEEKRGSVEVDQDGISIGPELGLEIPVSPTTRLVIAGGATWQRYANARVLLGPTFDNTAGSAWRYGMRVGIAVGEVP